MSTPRRLVTMPESVPTLLSPSLTYTRSRKQTQCTNEKKRKRHSFPAQCKRDLISCCLSKDNEEHREKKVSCRSCQPRLSTPWNSVCACLSCYRLQHHCCHPRRLIQLCSITLFFSLQVQACTARPQNDGLGRAHVPTITIQISARITTD